MHVICSMRCTSLEHAIRHALLQPHSVVLHITDVSFTLCSLTGSDVGISVDSVTIPPSNCVNHGNYVCNLFIHHSTTGTGAGVSVAVVSGVPTDAEPWAGARSGSYGESAGTVYTYQRCNDVYLYMYTQVCMYI